MRYRSCKDSFCDWLFTSAFFYGHQQLKTLRLYQSIGYQKENVNKIERCFFLCQLRKEQAANCFNRDGHILSIFHLLWAIHRDTHPFSLSLSLSPSLSCLKNQMRRDDDETGRNLAQATRTHCVSSSGGEIKGLSLYVARGTRSLHTSECEVPSRFFCSFTNFHAY